MEDLFDIDRTKKTHYRKDGMVMSQIMGLVKENAVWMSGHSTERSDKSYFSSLSPIAMKCNAGFFERPMELYYVPRARIVLPEAEGRLWREKLGPFLGVFKKSVERMGAKAQYAELNFVNKLLPQLLLVALQDGVYFVGDVKNHKTPWAVFLVDLLGQEYEQWAVEKYAWVLAEEKRYETSKYSNNWESVITGDFLREKKEEVMYMNQKHHPQKKEEIHISSPTISPAPPVLIRDSPHHPSTPRQRLVSLLPKPNNPHLLPKRLTPDSSIAGPSPHPIQRHYQNHILRVASPDNEQQNHVSDLQNIFTEDNLKNMDLPQPVEPNNRWPNDLPKTVELLVEEYYSKKMFEPTCHCRNRQIINK